MDASGKCLEEIVRRIEDRLKPAGCTVTSRDKVLDEDTGKIRAEFDIRITGPLGSSFMDWLVECRDRQGPQPGAWIEQLIGRKVVYGFQHVIAVSTGGFTASAIYAAEKGRILIRCVTDLTQLVDDFDVKDMVQFHPRFAEYKVEVLPQGIQLRRTGRPDSMRTIVLSDLRLREKGVGEFAYLPNFVSAHLPSIAVALEESSGKIRCHFSFQGQLEVRVGQELIEARGVELDYDLVVRTWVPKGMSTKIYSEGSRLIGQVHECEFELPAGIVRMAADVVYKGDGTAEFNVTRLDCPETVDLTQLLLVARQEPIAG